MSTREIVWVGIAVISPMVIVAVLAASERRNLRILKGKQYDNLMSERVRNGGFWMMLLLAFGPDLDTPVLRDAQKMVRVPINLFLLAIVATLGVVAVALAINPIVGLGVLIAWIIWVPKKAKQVVGRAKSFIEGAV